MKDAAVIDPVNVPSPLFSRVIAGDDGSVPPINTSPLLVVGYRFSPSASQLPPVNCEPSPIKDDAVTVPVNVPSPPLITDDAVTVPVNVPSPLFSSVIAGDDGSVPSINTSPLLVVGYRFSPSASQYVLPVTRTIALSLSFIKIAGSVLL